MEKRYPIISILLKEVKHLKDMKNFLLAFLLALFSFPNAYSQNCTTNMCTCVINNYSGKKSVTQDVSYIIHWEACEGKQYTSDLISDGLTEDPPTSTPICSDQTMYAKAKCPNDQVEIEIIGKSYPFPSNSGCKIKADPALIANSTFQVSGTGCKYIEPPAPKITKKKI